MKKKLLMIMAVALLMGVAAIPLFNQQAEAQTVQCRPTDLNAVQSGGSVVLTWTAPTDCDPPGYQVFRKGRSAGQWDARMSQLASVTGLSHTDSSVSAAESYRYKVRAEGANRKSAMTEITIAASVAPQVEAPPPPPPPPPIQQTIIPPAPEPTPELVTEQATVINQVPVKVTGLQAVPRDMSVRLVWDDSPYQGAIPTADYYIIQAQDENDPTWHYVMTDDPDDPGSLMVLHFIQSHATLVDLENGIGYKFRVQACNDIGCGQWSEQISVTPSPAPTCAQGSVVNGKCSKYIWFSSASSTMKESKGDTDGSIARVKKDVRIIVQTPNGTIDRAGFRFKMSMPTGSATFGHVDANDIYTAGDYEFYRLGQHLAEVNVFPRYTVGSSNYQGSPRASSVCANCFAAWVSLGSHPDDEAEGDETVVLRFDTSALNGFSVGTHRTHTVTIEDTSVEADDTQEPEREPEPTPTPVIRLYFDEHETVRDRKGRAVMHDHDNNPMTQDIVKIIRSNEVDVLEGYTAGIRLTAMCDPCGGVDDIVVPIYYTFYSNDLRDGAKFADRVRIRPSASGASKSIVLRWKHSSDRPHLTGSHRAQAQFGSITYKTIDKLDGSGDPVQDCHNRLDGNGDPLLDGMGEPLMDCVTVQETVEDRIVRGLDIPYAREGDANGRGSSMSVRIYDHDGAQDEKWVISNSATTYPDKLNPKDISGPTRTNDGIKLVWDMEMLGDFEFYDWNRDARKACHATRVNMVSKRNLTVPEGYQQATKIEWYWPVVSTYNGVGDTWRTGRNKGSVEQGNGYTRYITGDGNLTVDHYQPDSGDQWNRLTLVDDSTKGRSGRVDGYTMQAVYDCAGLTRYGDLIEINRAVNLP